MKQQAAQRSIASRWKPFHIIERMTTSFKNFWAYAYLVQKDADCVLIDAGSGTDSSHENLLSGLQQKGIQPSDLTHILLTHAHIDHFGGLVKLRPRTAAKICCHVLDVQTV